jgi:uncharacterized protein
MFSLQKVFGRDDEFCALFESCAAEASQSVRLLRSLFTRSDPSALEAFAASRRREKELSNQIADLTIHAFVTALEREDIEALAASLYRIPKTVEKFAERFFISREQLTGIDFTRQLNLMERAADGVLQMIKAWRRGATQREINQLNASIQKIESDADSVILELLGRLYNAEPPPLKAIIAKDLLELNEKVVDRFRDAGNVISRVVLKNS